MNGNWIKTEDGDSYSDFWGLIYLNEDDMAHWQEMVLEKIRSVKSQKVMEYAKRNPYITESTEKVHNVKWINNWTLLTGLLRNVKLLHIINVKYLRILLIFSTLAEKFSYARRLSANPVERICTHL